MATINDAPKVGLRHLASGARMAMRMWVDEKPQTKPSSRRAYETLGYVISGEAELTIGGETVALKPGVSWCVPADMDHAYTILATFTAIECTAPPATTPD